jgi:hypothetical protein
VVGLNSTYGARELNWTNQKRYKDALFVEATNPVTITQRILDPYNQEIITAKGRNALGTEFYVGSQTLINSTVSGNYAGYQGMHYISVVATEDSTNVKFKAPRITSSTMGWIVSYSPWMLGRVGFPRCKMMMCCWEHMLRRINLLR